MSDKGKLVISNEALASLTFFAAASEPEEMDILKESHDKYTQQKPVVFVFYLGLGLCNCLVMGLMSGLYWESKYRN